MTDGVCLAIGAFAQVVKGLITTEIKAGPIATFVKEKGPYDYWIAIALWAALGILGIFLICWQIA
jgi:hypothetical protein